MPAGTSSSVGSSAIRLAEGTTVCPRSEKKRRKRRAISADSISAAVLFVVGLGWVDCAAAGLEGSRGAECGWTPVVRQGPAVGRPAAGRDVHAVEPVFGAQLHFPGRGEVAHVGDELPQRRPGPRGGVDRPAGDVVGMERADLAHRPHRRHKAQGEVEQPPDHDRRRPSRARRTPYRKADTFTREPVIKPEATRETLAAWSLTSFTLPAMASTVTSCRLASPIVTDTSSSSGSTRSLSSDTIFVVSVSSRASFTSTMARKQVKIAQNRATISPA